MDDLATTDDRDRSIGWTTQRVLGTLVAVAIAAFWIWGFSPWAPRDKADGLQDKTFLATARAVCATMVERLDALPPARTSTTAIDRAEVVEKSGPVFADMIRDLRAAAAPLQGRDATLVSAWIADWESYASDREAYAARLRNDERAVFTVTRRGSGQITVTMDGFSRVNDLASCLVPQDV